MSGKTEAINGKNYPSIPSIFFFFLKNGLQKPRFRNRHNLPSWSCSQFRMNFSMAILALWFVWSQSQLNLYFRVTGKDYWCDILTINQWWDMWKISSRDIEREWLLLGWCYLLILDLSIDKFFSGWGKSILTDFLQYWKPFLSFFYFFPFLFFFLFCRMIRIMKLIFTIFKMI